MADALKQLDLLIHRSWMNSRDSYYELKGIPKEEVSDDQREEEVNSGTTVESIDHDKRIDGRSEDVESGGDSPSNGKMDVQLSDRFLEILQGQQDREALEKEIKDEIMRWFWKGYYCRDQVPEESLGSS